MLMAALAFETLPVLTEADFGMAIERRRLDTVQVCAFCGDRALFSYVAHTMAPPRWMDVCGPHSQYVRGAGPL